MSDNINTFLFEHYKQEHQFQRERTDKIRDRVSFVVGFLTVLGGILSYFVSGFPHAWQCGRTLLFYVPLTLAIALFVASALIVLWVVGGNFQYASIPSNPDLQKFCDDLTLWADAASAQNEVLPTLKQSLLIAYREASHTNFLTNRTRTDRLLLATRLVVVAFFFSAASLPAYIYEKSKQDKEPTLVRLVSAAKIEQKEPQTNLRTMSDSSSQNQQAATTPPAQAPQAAPPPKPVFPPNQLLSEGAVRMQTTNAPPPEKK